MSSENPVVREYREYGAHFQRELNPSTMAIQAIEQRSQLLSLLRRLVDECNFRPGPNDIVRCSYCGTGWMFGMKSRHGHDCAWVAAKRVVQEYSHEPTDHDG